jgi:ABC-type Zn uptake system ZnuABC Zn-binding protein ZnuA
MRHSTAIRSVWRESAFGLTALVLLTTTAHAQDRVKVVTTLPTYAAIALEVAGDLADIQAIARGDQDPHFVNPRPSFAAAVQRADLFVATGLDLELWVPAVLDRANNPRVLEGATGHVVAYAGIELLEVPDDVSRAGGDVHVFGNPHIHTDPINGIIIARNIAAGLKRVDPSHADAYDANLADFEDRVTRRLVGDALTNLLGGEAIFDMLRAGTFWDFLASQRYQGELLEEYLGGWLAEATPFRRRRMVCYHKNWAYFSHRFQIECAMFVEPKPGIPPSPSHVNEVIDFIDRENIPVLFAANYFSRRQVERVASRTGAVALMAPEHVDGEDGVDSYFALIDTWVQRLARAFTERSAHP